MSTPVCSGIADVEIQAALEPVEASQFHLFTARLCQTTLPRYSQLSAANASQICYSLGALQILNQPDLVMALSRHSYALMAHDLSSRRPSRQNYLNSYGVGADGGLSDPEGYDGDPTDPFADFGSSFSSTTLVVRRLSATQEGGNSGCGDEDGRRAESLESGLFDYGEHTQLGSNQAGGVQGVGAESSGAFAVQERSVTEATVSTFRPSDLAGLVWGLASLKFQPSVPWLDRWGSSHGDDVRRKVV